MFLVNGKPTDVIWGPKGTAARSKGTKPIVGQNHHEAGHLAGDGLKMSIRDVSSPFGLWKALTLPLSHFGSRIPALGMITLMKCIPGWWPHWSPVERDAKQERGEESCAAWKLQINGASLQGR